MMKRLSAAEWESRIADWERSGLDAEEYARGKRINPARLRHWRRRLRGRNGRPPRSARSTPAERPAFVQVYPSAAEKVEDGQGFDVVLHSGHRLQIRGCVDGQALRQVVHALEGQQ